MQKSGALGECDSLSLNDERYQKDRESYSLRRSQSRFKICSSPYGCLGLQNLPRFVQKQLSLQIQAIILKHAFSGVMDKKVGVFST
jgi:hypothetical protein